jgi:ABC-type antimicrobial peptide transport system permease subunit
MHKKISTFETCEKNMVSEKKLFGESTYYIVKTYRLHTAIPEV